MPIGIGTTWAKAKKKEAQSMRNKAHQMASRILKKEIVEIATVAKVASGASEEDACILIDLIERLGLRAFDRAEQLEKLTCRAMGVE